MSLSRNGEETLDEGVSANGHDGHTRAASQQVNTAASGHQLSTANPLDEGIESPPIVDALQRPSAEKTTDAAAAQDQSNGSSQRPSEQLFSAIENDRLTPRDHNGPLSTSTGGPIPSEKTEPQDQIDGHTFPEGGLRAWLVVLGSFSGMTASFGILNSAGTFQAYLSTHQLVHESPSAVGWIFSLYAFLTFFCGVQIGPVFDAYGPRWLVFAGTVLLFGGMMGVAESTSQ